MVLARNPQAFRPNDIEHRKTKVSSQRTHSFAHLDAWLHYYDHERPHLGYRNQDRHPWPTMERFVSRSSAMQRGQERHAPTLIALTCPRNRAVWRSDTGA
jgi:hypothetical protein